jgi:hypothetical protein
MVLYMVLYLLSLSTNQLWCMQMAPGAGHQCRLQSTCITGIHHYQLVTITIVIQYIQKTITVMECNCSSIQSGCRVSCCLAWQFVLTHLSPEAQDSATRATQELLGELYYFWFH